MFSSSFGLSSCVFISLESISTKKRSYIFEKKSANLFPESLPIFEYLKISEFIRASNSRSLGLFISNILYKSSSL